MTAFLECTRAVVVYTTFEDEAHRKIIYCKIDPDQSETEPNNTFPSSTPLTKGRFHQAMLSQDDADCFSFTLSAAELVELAYFAESNIADSQIDIFDQNLQLLASSISTDGSDVLFPMGLTAGVHYVKVSSTGEIDPDTPYNVVFQTKESLPEATETKMAVGEERTDRIFSLQDQRHFEFQLDSRQEAFVDFSTKSEIGDYTVELIDDAQQIIRSVQSIDGEGIRLERIAGPGEYAVVVSPGRDIDADSPFTVRLSAHEYFIETEPNNDLSTAALIEPGDTVQGILEDSNDNDIFKLEVTVPIYIRLSCGPLSNLTPFNISIHKDSEQSLINGINSLEGEMVELPMRLNVGTYFVNITRSDDGSTTTFPYRLALLQPPARDLEVESNNTLKFANPIGKDQTVEGRIFSLDDVDYYGFYLPERAIFSVEFNSDSTTGDYSISIVDGENREIERIDASNGAYQTFDTVQDAGNYHVMIAPGADLDSNRSYWITITSQAAIKGQRPLTNIIVAGEASEMMVSHTQQLTAIASYSDGDAEPLSDVKWTSLDESIATVSNTGYVKAIAEGSTKVVAGYGELAGKFNIIVGSQTNQKQHQGNLVLVAGGGADDADTLKESTQYLCNLVYRRFIKRFFTDEDIYYFNPIPFHDLDGDGHDDGVVDNQNPTVAAFNDAVTSWAVDQTSDGPLYLYLIDHGGVDAFKLFPGEILKAADLNDMLDAFQESTGRRVVVMIEACKSGTLSDDLIADGKDRIIVTSTDHRDAYIQLAGNISFTQFFIDRLLAGDSVYHGWRRAVEKLVNMGVPYNMMRPQLVAGLADIAAQTFLGGDFGIASLFPEFLDKTPDKEVSAGETLEIYAKVSDVDGIESAWARVLAPEYFAPDTSPDLEAPVVTTPIVPLQPTPEKDGTYTGTYAGFEYNGDYRFIFYARSLSGNTGTSPATSISVVNGKEFNRVAAPVFSVEPGTYISRATVHITCDTPNATIRYTLDGREPTEASPEYTAPIVIQDIRALKAKAFRANWTESHTASGFYTVVEQLGAPTFTPAPGAYFVPQSVIISSHSTGAKIYYTTDGSDPNENSLLYRSPIPLNATTIIKARAHQIDWAPSDTATAEYTIDLIEKGDIDGDKNVDIGDVVIILRLLSGISVNEESLQNYLEAGHTDVVDLKEAIGALRKAAGF